MESIILFSEKQPKTYVGCTEDVKARLQRHNEGRVVSTKNFRPWQLIYEEEAGDYKNARQREKYYKSSARRRKIADIITQWRDGRAV